MDDDSREVSPSAFRFHSNLESHTVQKTALYTLPVAMRTDQVSGTHIWTLSPRRATGNNAVVITGSTLARPYSAKPTPVARQPKYKVATPLQSVCDNANPTHTPSKPNRMDNKVTTANPTINSTIPRIASG